MLISTTDDTTMFVFEGTVNTGDDVYIINKNDDRCTKASYTKDTPQPTVSEEYKFATLYHLMDMVMLLHYI